MAPRRPPLWSLLPRRFGRSRRRLGRCRCGSGPSLRRSGNGQQSEHGKCRHERRESHGSPLLSVARRSRSAAITARRQGSNTASQRISIRLRRRCRHCSWRRRHHRPNSAPSRAPRARQITKPTQTRALTVDEQEVDRDLLAVLERRTRSRRSPTMPMMIHGPMPCWLIRVPSGPRRGRQPARASVTLLAADRQLGRSGQRRRV